MNRITQKELAKVERGVALLDYVKPKWFRSLNHKNFNLGDESTCVLGSVYGEYFDGLRSLADEAITKVIHDSGLKLSVDHDGGEVDGDYYGFLPSSNAQTERMGQTWLYAANLRLRRAARARARKRANG